MKSVWIVTLAILYFALVCWFVAVYGVARLLDDATP